MNLRSWVRAVPDFPKPGIMFRDITPILASPEALRETIRQLSVPWRSAGISKVLAAEARDSFSVHRWRWSCRRDLFRSASPANCHGKRIASAMTSNTVPIHSKSTPTPSPPAIVCCSSTTCWPPAARWKPV